MKERKWLTWVALIQQGLETHLPVNTSHSSQLRPENQLWRQVGGRPLPQSLWIFRRDQARSKRVQGGMAVDRVYGYSNECCCLVQNQISDCLHILAAWHIQLFETLWTVALQVPLSMGILQARILEWDSHSVLQGIFSSKGWSSGLPDCRQIPYCLSSKYQMNVS